MYGADRPKEMEADFLSICKVFQVNQGTVDNICADGFRSVLRVSLIETEQDREFLYACSDNNGDKIALRYVLKRCKQ
jgi:hypothetical protein